MPIKSLTRSKCNVCSTFNSISVLCLIVYRRPPTRRNLSHSHGTPRPMVLALCLIRESAAQTWDKRHEKIHTTLQLHRARQETFFIFHFFFSFLLLLIQKSMSHISECPKRRLWHSSCVWENGFMVYDFIELSFHVVTFLCLFFSSFFSFLLRCLFFFFSSKYFFLVFCCVFCCAACEWRGETNFQQVSVCAPCWV